jgi:hypothetical protein
MAEAILIHEGHEVTLRKNLAFIQQPCHFEAIGREIFPILPF